MESTHLISMTLQLEARRKVTTCPFTTVDSHVSLARTSDSEYDILAQSPVSNQTHMFPSLLRSRSSVPVSSSLMLPVRSGPGLNTTWDETGCRWYLSLASIHGSTTKRDVMSNNHCQGPGASLRSCTVCLVQSCAWRRKWSKQAGIQDSV